MPKPDDQLDELFDQLAPERHDNLDQKIAPIHWHWPRWLSPDFPTILTSQSIGLILIDQRTIILMGIIVAIIDAVLIYFTVKLLQRETILTRWK